MHQQPMLAMVSRPAPESVVNSFPVKIHMNSEELESADDLSQYVFPAFRNMHVTGKGDSRKRGLSSKGQI